MSPTEADTPGWRPSTVRLKFLAGEFLLGACQFSGEHWAAPLAGAPSIMAATVDAEGWALPADVPVRYVSLLPFEAAPPPLLSRNRVLRYIPRYYWHSTIDLTLSPAQYWAQFSSKTRTGIRRKTNRLQRELGDTFVLRKFTNPSEMPEFYALARRLSAVTYQERLLGAGLPEEPEYLDEIQAAAKCGLFLGYMLLHGARPVAYMACPVQDGVVSYDHVGYDPEYRHLSPGTVLLALALDDMMSAGRFRVFDFTAGDGEHKRLFSTSRKRCGDVYYFHKRGRIMVLVFLHRALSVVMALGARVAHRLSLAAPLKRFLRSVGSGAKHAVL